MIVEHAVMDIFVHRVCSVRMPRKLIIAVAVLCVVLTFFSLNVIYVGFLIILNDKCFDKNMACEKIHLVVIVPQHFAVDHVLSVKKLDFSNAEVCLNNYLLSLISSSYLYRSTTRCYCCDKYCGNWWSTYGSTG
jgi:hypothetical protein